MGKRGSEVCQDIGRSRLQSYLYFSRSLRFCLQWQLFSPTELQESMRSMGRLILCGLMFLICLPAVAQQTDINRYTLFTGFDYMISPARNLTERGFESDFGVTVRPWLGLGGDFGVMGRRRHERRGDH